jgi:hypothetical protein
MNRKNFLKGTLGVAATGTFLGAGKAFSQATVIPDCETRLTGKNKFLIAWINAWIENLKKDLPDADMTRLIEANGRACAENHGMVAGARALNGDIDKFLAEMGRHIGAANARRSGSKVTLVYENCYCPLVSDTAAPIPGEFCLCTRGWTKAVLGAITGREIPVFLKATIKRGDPACIIEADLA